MSTDSRPPAGDDPRDGAGSEGPEEVDKADDDDIGAYGVVSWVLGLIVALLLLIMFLMSKLGGHNTVW